MSVEVMRVGDDRIVVAEAGGDAVEACGLAAERYATLREAGERVLLARSPEDAQAHEAASRGERLPRSTVWIGQCSNTWRSDLNLPVDYVRTTGPADMAGATVVQRHPTLCPWMAGIPGTVGGWIKMNAGAFGHSFSEALEAVQVGDAWLSAADCGFGYRTSRIVGEIVDFRLRKEPLRTQDGLGPSDYLARRKRFPAGTFGSTFKNPPGDFAGRLLEAAGAKGLTVGGVRVWSEHANVIVRGVDATPSDALAVIWLMRRAVWARFGVALEPEVCGIASAK